MLQELDKEVVKNENERLQSTVKALESCHKLERSLYYNKIARTMVTKFRVIFDILYFTFRALRFLKKKINKLKSHSRKTSSTKQKEVSPTDLSDMHNRKIAVVIHLYHTDLIEEIVNYLSHIQFNFDLFINAVSDSHTNIKEKTKILSCNLHLDSFENKGRDVLPFLKAVKKYQLQNFDYICKIHTKKSLHTTFGNDWRFALMNSMLADKSRVNSIFKLFENNNKIGLIGCEELHFNLPIDPKNRKNFNFLMKHYRISHPRFNYIAGTMFWCRGKVLNKIEKFPLEDHLFAVEKGDTDGNLDHAFERVFGALCFEQKLEIKGLSLNTEKEIL